MATGMRVGLWPNLAAKAAISVDFISRLIGPTWATPEARATGAVPEPLPSTWIFTFGYWALKPSLQKVMRLFRVSEPTEFRLPDTPEVTV